MNKYKINKAKAIDEAIEWQSKMWGGEISPSYGELWETQQRFTKLGKRYGLLKEFRENGII